MDALISLMEQTQVLVAVIGLVVLLLLEQAHPFFDFFQGSLKKKGAHFIANLSLGFVNALLIALIFTGLWLWAAEWANDHNFGILNWLNLPVWARVIGAVLLMDTWTYFWHRMNHSIPLFWRFHRVHHADPNMDVSTASRFHTGEIIFSSLLRIPVIMLIGLELWELLVYSTLLVVVVQFHHANIGLPDRVDRILRWFIVTPGMHKVHHSRWQPETDSNYSSLFSFWDRLCRTFRTHDPLNEIQLGLDEFDTESDQQISGLFSMPFRRGREKSG